MTMNDESRASVRDGGTAFPQSSLRDYVNGGGMSKREYIAIAAMQAMITGHISYHGHDFAWPEQSIADEAFKQADAMIQARGH